MKKSSLLIVAFVLLLNTCTKNTDSSMNIFGEWKFQIDSLDTGIAEKWYNQRLTDRVKLPGSMAENGKGNDVSVNTEWTGQIIDTSWYTDAKYERYRQPGNIKIPFWLQPRKHFVGIAWYQKEIEIPADWNNKAIELFLERCHWESQVWIDEQWIGMRNSLATAHVYDLTSHLSPGRHRLSIRVDNRINDINPGINSHSISDHTQSNWNGIVGRIEVAAKPLVHLKEIKLFPDINNKHVVIKVGVKNATGGQQSCTITAKAESYNGSVQHNPGTISKEITIEQDELVEFIYPMSDSPLLWDEFHPNLYSMNIILESHGGVDSRSVSFGMREFKTNDTRFSVNGRPVFLRGTLECAIFPKTGYPAMDVAEWTRIFKTIKAHGLNHMRFHSWCPPEAAFVAADNEGIYLQVECSSWANSGSSLGDGKPIDKWMYDEANHILDFYGNHPSFCMMAYGNEPAGAHQTDYLTKFVSTWKEQDSRRVYTGAAGWPFIENADYFNDYQPRIQLWGAGVNSIINKNAPQTLFDFREIINKISMPYVSHEIGQWCVYPDFKEIEKYKGVLQAKNFEIFKETLEENHLGHLAEQFLLASGKLQALCYKADIEAALRTPGFAGFQLLDLHDFPGQGTALVGVLNAFWEEKGYISPMEFSRFCSPTVPLARLEKRIFLNNEKIAADIEVAHFGEKPLKDVHPEWRISNTANETIASGTLKQTDIPIGNEIKLGRIEVAVDQLVHPQKLVLRVAVAGHENSWDLWVYPAKLIDTVKDDHIRIVQRLDSSTIEYLESGGSVLLTPIKGSVKPEMGGDIGIGFSSIFWNTAWTSGQEPHTLGILCTPEHPALAKFPTEYHSNWQWWDAMSHSNAIILDEFTPELQPIVRVIDDWFQNRRLALIFEVKIGAGKLLISGIDLLSEQEHRPEARQLLHSLSHYMSGDQFNPKVNVSLKEVHELFLD
ncbi:MAG: sugar-binding domain-containing protein [Candidatus Zhuqueibacterota bacterium]